MKDSRSRSSSNLCCCVSKKVSPSISAPLHLILQAPSPATHQWRTQPAVKRVCQICHFTLDGQQGLKCSKCGLRAHSKCGSSANNNNNRKTSSTSSNNNNINNANAAENTAVNNTNNNYNNNNLLTTVSTTTDKTCTASSSGSHFEPRIKKLLQVSIPPPQSVHSEQSQQSTSRLSSDSAAASTAIVVGTTTVSTETPRSESKSPEITITPGSDVAEEHRHPSSAASGAGSVPLPDSGCSGDLLDGQFIQSKSRGQHQDTRHIRYIDGPLDGALYAIVQPAKTSFKPPSSADSGISVSHVDQMKDLDRLLNALVQDAESIPDIPYHAREDSLPFSYGMPDTATLKHRQELQERLAQRQQQREREYVSPVARSENLYSSYSPAPTTTTNVPYSTPSRLPEPIYGQSQQQQQQYQQQQQHQHPQSTQQRVRVFQDVPDHSSYNQPRQYVSSQLLQRATPSHSHSHSQIHPIQLESLESQIIPPTSSSSYERSRQENESSNRSRSEAIRTMPINSASRSDQFQTSNSSYTSWRDPDGTFHFYSSTPQPQAKPEQQQQPSTSTSLNNFGRAIENVEKRIRSQSAEGRRYNTYERDENADEWLSRQKKKLEEKRLKSQRQMQAGWINELKKSLPSEKQLESSDHTLRPSSYKFDRFGPPRSNVSTPAFYSSDDDESSFDREAEREMYGYGRDFGRGRRLQRYHSESAYDRRAAAAAAPSQQQYQSQSTYEQQQRQPPRPPSQQSYSSDYTQTPGFPTCPPTPYLNRPVSPKPPRSPKTQRKLVSPTRSTPIPIITSNEYRPRTPTTTHSSRATTPVNPRPVFMIESEVKFARDLSSYWYKPNATREEAIAALRYQPTGSFVVRNSNSFPGAFGLAIKVNENMTTEDSVRHFLIEPTKYGVRLRGSAVEPVFGSLSALVYAHSIDALALPTTLTLPTSDTVLPSSQAQSTTAQLLSQGAACQLLFIGVAGVECITGDDAVKRGIAAVTGTPPTIVSLRLSKQGLSLTDIFRQRFFRLHFPLAGISYAALDPSNKCVTYKNASRKIFAVVARASSALENSCVVLAELEEGQPANAIVAFIQRVIAWQS